MGTALCATVPWGMARMCCIEFVLSLADQAGNNVAGVQICRPTVQDPVRVTARMTTSPGAGQPIPRR
jgi:hypothetical protein